MCFMRVLVRPDSHRTCRWSISDRPVFRGAPNRRSFRGRRARWRSKRVRPWRPQASNGALRVGGTPAIRVVTTPGLREATQPQRLWALGGFEQTSPPKYSQMRKHHELVARSFDRDDTPRLSVRA